MPLVVHLAIGESINIDTSSLILDLLWMIVLPSVLAMILNQYTNGKMEEKLGKKLAPFSKIALFLIVMINSSIIAPYVKNMSWELARIIVIVFIVAISGYILWLLIGHFIWKDPTLVSTLVFTGGMRNIAVGIVIASSYFPPRERYQLYLGCYSNK